MAGVIAEVAIPTPARPGLDHPRERLAVRHLPARPDLLQDHFKRYLQRLGAVDFPVDPPALAFLLRHAHSQTHFFLLNALPPPRGSLVRLALGALPDAVELVIPERLDAPDPLDQVIYRPH